LFVVSTSMSVVDRGVENKKRILYTKKVNKFPIPLWCLHAYCYKILECIIVSMRLFRSYKEAHKVLRIPGSYQRGTHGTAETGVTSLKITVHTDSYDKILDNGATIFYVGKGNKPTPAHPAKSQDSKSQDVFRKSIETQNPFPVLHKEGPEVVKLLGQYRVVGLKRATRQGVQFYYAILKSEN